MMFQSRRFLKYRLLAPGPVQLHPKVQEALALPMIHHRTPEFEAILERTLGKLSICFQTREQVMCLAAAGSGAMESALVNTLSPGDEILAIVSGKFGERWAKMAQVFGMKVHALHVPWGEAVQVEAISDALKRNGKIKALITQACETSTATEHPIYEISQFLKASYPEVLFMVDAITAIGAMNLPVDEWGLDVVVSGSQKAFMLPAGLSFVSLSQKAWAAEATARCPRYYFNLSQERDANAKKQTYFSSAVTHIRALDVALDDLVGISLQNTIRRTRLMAKTTREAMVTLGLAIYSKSPAGAVTAIELPKNAPGEQLRDHLEKEYRVTVMGGQDQLKGRILRMGHLGYIPTDDFCAGIEAIGLGAMDLKVIPEDHRLIEQVSEMARSRLESTNA
jgi:aspartate aminotransferase-like enzyme